MVQFIKNDPVEWARIIMSLIFIADADTPVRLSGHEMKEILGNKLPAETQAVNNPVEILVQKPKG